MSDTYATVLKCEFIARMIAAIADAAFRDGPTVYLGSEPAPDGRTKFVLRVGAVRRQAFVDGPRPAELDAARAGAFDQQRALDMIVAWLDCLAGSLWQRIGAGEILDARDMVFLKHWTEFRSPCGSRLSVEEAERLFGDAPEMLLDDQGLTIDWEGPERVTGLNPDYMRRKEVAKEMFACAVNDAYERFAGACNAAFLPMVLAPLKRSE